MFLLFFLLAITLDAQSPLPKPLDTPQPLRDKNFYFLTLAEAHAAPILAHPQLQQLAATKRQALAKAAASCKMDVPCHTAAYRFTPEEIETSTQALVSLAPQLKPLLTAARLSGAFIRYNALPDTEFLARLWREAASHINRFMDIYAEGKPPRYPAIDSIAHDVKGQRLGFRIDVISNMLDEKNSEMKLFYDAPLRFAIMLLELNWRDEAARHEPLHTTENLAPSVEATRTDFSRYPYTAIIVPGAGGDRLTTPMDPAARWRAQLAAERYRRGQAPFILVSGGYVHPNQTPFNEAIEMRRVLVNDFGIPASAVFIDPHARHTTTNIRNAARILFRAGIPLERPVLITTDQHQSAGIESPAAMLRCEKELGYRPVQILKRTGRFDLEAKLLIDSLQLDAIEPLDP
jgi:hypothetical protein